jgi:hypothetical protein
MMFLVSFWFDHYCQGTEDAYETCLVYAVDFEEACDKISKQYDNARDFENKTIK